MMNIFRLIGDVLHLASFLILLYFMLTKKKCAGISLKSQVLYAVVFSTRYIDILFGHFVNPYVFSMKILFLMLSWHVVYLIRNTFRSTYDHNNDTFHVSFLIGFAVVFALLFNYGYTPLSLLYAFSEWLEAVAALPQMHLIQRLGGAQDVLTYHYLVALGGYRLFYIFNWIWRYFVEGKVLLLQWAAGTLQTAMFADLFYHYFTCVLKEKKLALPQ
eukprot:TRINITY_DN72374_c0_g1_i1.p1 TRINITY_DN72374_c0_g1~~TRINITY_DN72374_c0_g1_i1.p1  ORF type:complete len:216 (-),score=45.04 TRINITY_DN72374_c0_g1_i1:597-1244(-)